jgi:hypothetical protein
MQDKQDKETSTDEVQTEYKRTQTKKSPVGNGRLYLMSLEYCHVEVSATGRSLI